MLDKIKNILLFILCSVGITAILVPLTYYSSNQGETLLESVIMTFISVVITLGGMIAYGKKVENDTYYDMLMSGMSPEDIEELKEMTK